jgi:hypothetical protein
LVEVLGVGCPYTIERTWTATDACGNSVSATQVISVIDEIDPVLVGVPANVTVECDNIPAIAVVTATDNCATDLVVEFDTNTDVQDCGAMIYRTWTVTDYCGNTTTSTQVITVVDTTLPELTDVPADVMVECDDIPAVADVNAMDNCDIAPEILFSEETVYGDCGATIYRTWIATDNCGNEVSHTQEITLIDTTAPVISEFPSNTTAECDAIPAMGTVEASDNCDIDLTITATEETETLECGSIITRTWTVTDNCGNAASVSQVIEVVDTIDPVFIMVPADMQAECGVEVEVGEVEVSDNCDTDLDIIFSEETNFLACGYELVRIWRATDNCGNYTIASQTITFVDTTSPTFDNMPADEVVLCENPLEIPVVTASDVCDANVDVTYEEEIGEGCPYSIVRTWTATDDCGNQNVHTQVVSVIDEVAPQFVNVEVDVTVSCDEIEAYMVEVIDNCDNEVELTFSDESTGFVDPNADTNCEMLTPLEMNGINWATWLQGFPFGLDYYNADAVQFLTYADGTAHLFGHVSSSDNANGGWDIDVWFMDGVDWNSWDNMPFPTNYKDDEDLAGNNYLDWTYYILDGTQSTMTGTGDFEGSVLNLTHAPASLYYAFQLGIAANNVSAGYGLGGWFYYNGIFMDASTGYESAVSGAGDFAFEGNCCNADDIVRTWVAVDNCGNETVFVQNINVVDEEAPVIYNVPENITLVCGDEIPAAPDNVYATDNCDENVELVFNETQSSQFCPYVITRTWTATDDCGNVTVATQTITVTFEAPQVVFMNSYPNPFDDQFGFEFSLPSTQKVDVKVVDALGKTVLNIFTGEAEGGVLYQYKLSQLDWEEGMYTIMLVTEKDVHHKKMLSISK